MQAQFVSSDPCMAFPLFRPSCVLLGAYSCGDIMASTLYRPTLDRPLGMASLTLTLPLGLSWIVL